MQNKKEKATNVEIWGYSRLLVIQPLLIWNLNYLELKMTALFCIQLYVLLEYFNRALYINVWDSLI